MSKCLFENGTNLVDGSCGVPILNEDDEVVGLFRYKMLIKPDNCLAVLACTLWENDMESTMGCTHFQPV